MPFNHFNTFLLPPFQLNSDLFNKIISAMYFNNYFVYITTNPRKTTLYTGVTNDLKTRIQQHFENRGKRKTFAGKYYCYNLVYYEHYENIDQAISREKEIKDLSREKKEKLISDKNPQWKFYDYRFLD